MKKILLTAFEPFGEIENNSSLEVIKRVKEVENTKIIKKVLKVDYNLSNFENLLDEDVDILLLCGQASRSCKIALEQVAINFMYSKQNDNAGNKKLGEKIYLDGPDAYFNTIDATNLVLKLEDKYPLILSLSAGAYICNLSYYVSLYQCNKQNLKTKIGFIHFPLYTNQTSKDYQSIDLDIMVNTLNEIIKEIVK